MGGSLTVGECLKLAQESMSKARASSDPVMRDQYEKLAQNLQQLAAALTANSAE